MNFLRKHFDYIFLTILATVFFGVYLFLYSGVPQQTASASDSVPFLILNQPDEVVNYAFIREFVFGDGGRINEPLSAVSFNQIHPRSTTVIRGELAPIAFPGFIVLSGVFVFLFTVLFSDSLFNVLAVSFTPLLASVTPIVWYGFLRMVWERRVAWLSAVLLFFLPPWWYYASRPFQPNTLFLFCLVVAVFCLMRAAVRETPSREAWLASFFGFLFLALYVRPIEVVWLMLGLVLLYSATRSLWKKTDVFIFGAVGGIALLAFLTTQNWFYGDWFGTGYVKPAPTGESGQIFAGTSSISFWQALLAPFGIHPLVIIKNVYHYLWQLFSPWGLFAVLGLIFFLASERKDFFSYLSGRKIYLVLYGFITILLLLYYGSWGFFDNLAGVWSIGSSHVRYFLPIYVGALPFVATAFFWFFGQTTRFVKGIAAVLLIFLFLQSVQSVFFSFEGLSEIKTTVHNYSMWQKQVYAVVPPEGVVVTVYADKYLYPERKIIAGFTDTDRFTAVVALLEAGYQVYWFDPAAKVAELEEALSHFGLQMSAPLLVIENLELRQVVFE